jgi:hypothetical protein
MAQPQKRRYPRTIHNSLNRRQSTRNQKQYSCLRHTIQMYEFPLSKYSRFLEMFRCSNFLSQSLFVFGTTAPQWARASSFTRRLDHTQRCTTVGRTRLDERSARCRGLYRTTHKIYNRHAPVVFEPTISAGERPQTYALLMLEYKANLFLDLVYCACKAHRECNKLH